MRGRIYVLLAAATLFAWLLLNSSYFTWHGGYTTGPRFLVPAGVLLGPLIASGWSRLPVLTSCLLAVSAVNQLAIATVWLQVPDTYTNPLVEVVYPRFLAGDYVRGNLGMRFGLTGLWSISPVVITLGLALLTAVRILRAKDTVRLINGALRAPTTARAAPRAHQQAFGVSSEPCRCAPRPPCRNQDFPFLR